MQAAEEVRYIVLIMLSLSPLGSVATLLFSHSQEEAELDSSRISEGNDQEHPTAPLPEARDADADDAQASNGQAGSEAVVIVKVSPTMIIVDYRDSGVAAHFEPITGPMVPSFPPYRRDQPTKVEVYRRHNPYSNITNIGFAIEPSPLVPATLASGDSTDGVMFSQVWPAGCSFSFIVKFESASTGTSTALAEDVCSFRFRESCWRKHAWRKLCR